jgi:hypothetical protein
MTKTVQNYSSAVLNETDKDLTKDSSDKDDNLNIFLSVFDDLNKFYEALNRLDHVIDKYNITQGIYNKGENK